MTAPRSLPDDFDGALWLQDGTLCIDLAGVLRSAGHAVTPELELELLREVQRAARERLGPVTIRVSVVAPQTRGMIS